MARDPQIVSPDQREGARERARARVGVGDGAEIRITVFRACQPVSPQHDLAATAERPTEPGLRLTDDEGTESAATQRAKAAAESGACRGRLHVQPGGAAGR